MGFVNISLSERIIPDLLVIHHASVSEIADFTSAPRKIQIFSENNLLSQGTFDPNNDTSSVFQLDKISEPIGSLRLDILSNWGNAAYTCIYNVQIFSTKSKENQKLLY